MATPSHRSDFGAALTGLIVGGCILFALLFGIVVMTSRSYPSEPKAGATQ